MRTRLNFETVHVAPDYRISTHRSFESAQIPGPGAVTSNLPSPESSCRKGGNSLFWKNFRTFLDNQFFGWGHC
jgi:hypothetical protein